MSIITCSGEDCDQQLIANSESSEGYCPECAGSQPSHGKDYSQRQAESQEAAEQRERIINGDVWRDIE